MDIHGSRSGFSWFQVSFHGFFMVPGWFLWFLVILIVSGRFLWLFMVPGWFFMVEGRFSWFFMVPSRFSRFFTVSG